MASCLQLQHPTAHTEACNAYRGGGHVSFELKAELMQPICDVGENLVDGGRQEWGGRGTHRGEAGIVASLVVHGLGENSHGIRERLVIHGRTIAHPAQGVGIASTVALIPL